MSIQKPSRELYLGEIIGQAFNLYSIRFTHLFIVFLVATLVNEAFSAAVNSAFQLPPQPGPGASMEEVFLWLQSFFVTLIVMLALTLIVTWIVNTVAEGVVVRYVSVFLEKGDAKLGGAFNFTLSKLGSLLAAGVITAVLVVIGLILLIVPGIIMAIMFALFVPVIMIEQMGALESLSRSRRLVSRRWGKTFVVFLLIIILYLVVGFVADFISSPFGVASPVISAIMTAIFQPILPIALTFLYYSMLIKEAAVSELQPV